MKSWQTVLILAIVAGTSTIAFAVQDTVIIDSFAFSPDIITINEGDTVVWTNLQSISHTSTSDDSIWLSPLLATGQSFSFAFDSAGTFPYHCTPHPFMTATVDVLPAVVPDVIVDIGNFFFSPAVIQIDIGQTVRWINTVSVIHTSTADGGLWDSGDLGLNDFFDFTFTTEGVYDYTCFYHPLQMDGTVIVGTPDSISAEIMMGEFFFNPDSISVPVGSFVRWINFGNIIHTVTDTTAGYFDSGDMLPGNTFTLSADSIGDFYYLCVYHPVQMTGVLNVTDTSSSGGCDYVVGDVNGSSSYNGLDITYGVSFFKGGPDPQFTCECTSGNTWFVSGDVNGSCGYNGLDITYGVSFFKGGPGPVSCGDCPPTP